jgi:hypothetical protein
MLVGAAIVLADAMLVCRASTADVGGVSPALGKWEQLTPIPELARQGKEAVPCEMGRSGWRQAIQFSAEKIAQAVHLAGFSLAQAILESRTSLIGAAHGRQRLAPMKITHQDAFLTVSSNVMRASVGRPIRPSRLPKLLNKCKRVAG